MEVRDINELSMSGTMLYRDMRPVFLKLGETDTGKLVLAMMDYAFDDIVPKLEDRLDLVWPLFQQKIDLDAERYRKAVLQKKYASYCREHKKKDESCMPFGEWKEVNGWYQPISPVADDDSRYPYTNTETNTETETETETETDTDTTTSTSLDLATGEGANESHNTQRFIRPTFEEVEEYCRSRGNLVNAELFFNFYESNGWKTGRNPMKDWKASVRCWEIKNKDKLEKEGNRIRTEEDYQADAAECF